METTNDGMCSFERGIDESDAGAQTEAKGAFAPLQWRSTLFFSSSRLSPTPHPLAQEATMTLQGLLQQVGGKEGGEQQGREMMHSGEYERQRDERGDPLHRSHPTHPPTSHMHWHTWTRMPHLGGRRREGGCAVCECVLTCMSQSCFLLHWIQNITVSQRTHSLYVRARIFFCVCVFPWFLILVGPPTYNMAPAPPFSSSSLVLFHSLFVAQSSPLHVFSYPPLPPLSFGGRPHHFSGGGDTSKTKIDTNNKDV